MDSVVKFFEKVFAVIFFIGALSMFFRMDAKINQLHMQMKYTNPNKSIYQKESPAHVNLTMGGDILNEIYKGLEADIYIDGYRIDKNRTLVKEDILQIDLDSTYERKIQIVEGEVKSINYNKRGR